MMPYMLVSKTWYKYFQSDDFIQHMWRHPRMALLKLKLSHDIERNGNLALFHACKALIDVETSRKLILRARNPVAFEHLWSVPILSATRLSTKAYMRLLNNAVNKGVLNGPIFSRRTSEFKNNPRTAIEDRIGKIVSSPKLLCAGICLTQLLKLAFLDDMHDPNNLTLPFQYLDHVLAVAYHKNQGGSVKKILDDVRLVFLPYRRDNLLYVCVEYRMLLAAYIGEREYLQFINLDYQAISQMCTTLTKDEEQILCALKSVQDGQREVFPVEFLGLAQQLLEFHKSDGPLGFDTEQIVARSTKILNDPDVSNEIKRIVFENLYSGLLNAD
jgi:hypothetical protein